MNLKKQQLVAMRAALEAGYMLKHHGLVELQLAKPRTVDDELRRRVIPTGDFQLTGWGKVVAANFEFQVEQLKPGTLMNHRIKAYEGDTIVLCDDSYEPMIVDVKRPMRVTPTSGDGQWDIPLVEGGWSPTSAKMGWYLRNYLQMDVSLKLDHDSDIDFFASNRY